MNNKYLDYRTFISILKQTNGNMQNTVNIIQSIYGKEAINLSVAWYLIKNPIIQENIEHRKIRGKKRKIYGSINKDEYIEILKLLEDHKNKSKYNKKNMYPLSGICKCAVCNSNFVIINNFKGLIYYKCGNRKCTNRKNVRYSKLEIDVYKILVENKNIIVNAIIENEMQKNNVDLENSDISTLSIIVNDVLSNLDFWLELDNETKWEVNHLLLQEILINDGDIVSYKLKL